MHSLRPSSARVGSATDELVIEIAAATASGPTVLAAFDAALMRAGIANFNLIRLSSVIPPGSVVHHVERGPQVIDLTASAEAGRDGWGDRLYAVWAFQGAEKLGEEAWAGVAWVQDPDDRRGLFVEHEGSSEAQVREELQATLSSISAARGLGHLEQQSVVTGVRCEGPPVAALVIAPFATASW
jgi:arginine decarboxylase